MALPLGKKSLTQIERRRDPVRRIVELTTLLEWLLRLRPPMYCKLDAAVPPLQTVMQAYAKDETTLQRINAAIDVRNRLVHCVPGVVIPSGKEVEAATRTLTKSVQAMLGSRPKQTDDGQSTPSWQAANDPLGELGEVADAEDSGHSTELQNRVRTALWRLDIVKGWRAPFTIEALTHAGTHARLERHARHLTTTRLSDVEEALELESSPAREVLSAAATSLEHGLDILLAFDAQWTIAPGVLPIPAIFLEPDILTRIRHLTTLVEHLLAWIVPRVKEEDAAEFLQEDCGRLFEELLELNGHLLPDPDEVLRAVTIRNRLVRVVPDAPPVLSAEVEQAERVLWQAAFELRRHADLEHSDAISRYDDAPLRTIPRSQMWSIPSRAARLMEQIERARSLALMWEGANPGGWAVPADGRRIPLISSMLARHPWQDIHDSFPILDAADKLVERGAIAVQEAVDREQTAPWEETINVAIHLLEHELGWMDRPRPLTAKGDARPVIQPSIKEIPVVEPPPRPAELIVEEPAMPLVEKYPVNSIVKGVVVNVTNYGAFIQLEQGLNGLLHISNMSWRRVNDPNEVVQQGQEIACMVLSIEEGPRKVGLGLKQLAKDPWEADYPRRFAEGKTVRGTITRLASFGFFVELEPGLEGLVHISEIADYRVEDVADEVDIGQQVAVAVINFDVAKKKIGLSCRQAGGLT